MSAVVLESEACRGRGWQRDVRRNAPEPDRLCVSGFGEVGLRRAGRVGCWGFLVLGMGAGAQVSVPATFGTVPAFRMDGNPLVIRRPARAKEPFSVTGGAGGPAGAAGRHV